MEDVKSPFQPSSSSSMDDIPLETTATSAINFDDDDDDALYAFFDHALLETLFYDETLLDHGDDNPNNNNIAFHTEENTGVVSAVVSTKEDDSYYNHYNESNAHQAAAVAVAPQFLPQGSVSASSITATQHDIPFFNNSLPTIATPMIAMPSTATTATAPAYSMPTAAAAMSEHQIAALQADLRNGLAAAAVLSQRQQQQQQQQQQPQHQLLINTTSTTTRSNPAAIPGLLSTTASSLQPYSSIPFSTNSIGITNKTDPHTHHLYPIQQPYQMQQQPNTKKKRKSKKNTLHPLAIPSSTTLSIPTPRQNSNSMSTLTNIQQQHPQHFVISGTTSTTTTNAINQTPLHLSKDTPSPTVTLPPTNVSNTTQNNHNNHADRNNNNDKRAATTSLEEAEKLVSHFASLAEKLGISLPQNVLASLTRTAAVMHGERHQQEPGILPPSLSQLHDNATAYPSTTTPLSAPLSHHRQQQEQQPKLNTSSFIPPSSDNSTQQQQSLALVTNNANQILPNTNVSKIIPSILSTIPPLVTSTVAETECDVTTNQGGVESVGGNTKVLAVGALDVEEQESSIGTVTAQPHCDDKSTTTTTTTTTSAAAVAATMAPKKRKRPRVEECERKLSALKDENRILKLHLDAVLEKTKTADLERAQAERDMREMVQHKGGTAVDKEKLQKLVTRFTEMYADYGKSRQQELRFHLEQLRKLSTPSTFTKMSLWTLGQNDRFFYNPKKNSLGDILRLELQITPAQVKKIVERRQSIRSLTANIKQALDLLEKLRLLCEWKQQIFHSRMSKCQEVLTPMQVVKLLIWVNDNAETLDQVCPGWGSERIKGTVSPGHDVPSAPSNLGKPHDTSPGKENTVLPSSEPA